MWNYLTDKMKRSFFQAAVVSILLYGCNTWTLSKRLEKKLDGNYTRMLRAILNKSWRQHPTRHQLYGHLPPITKTTQVRRTRHAGHCWRSKDELISDVLLWTPTYGQAKAGRPARTYIQQLYEDTGCNPEDLPEEMNDREKWRARVRDICAGGTTWWWWWYVFLLIDQWSICGSFALWVECSPKSRKVGVQSQVELYQRLKKWYLIPPRLTLSIIRYVSRVKWSNPGEGLVPSPTSWCSSYWKGILRVTLANFSFYLLINFINDNVLV